MQAKIQYQFSGPLWKSESQGAWVFVSLPLDLSKEIREHFQWQEEGWGRLKASASIQYLEWDTAIWFDSKQQIYLLPVKVVIRKKANLKLGDKVTVSLWL